MTKIVLVYDIEEIIECEEELKEIIKKAKGTAKSAARPVKGLIRG